MMMFRSDIASDGGLGGGAGLTSSRKSHPIFKVRSTNTGDAGQSDSSRGGGIWSLLVCNINLNDSDPRFRPPICSTLVGFTTTGLGIAALLFRQYSVAFISGIVVTSLGVGILLFSLVWLFLTRQKVLKALALKAAGITDDCLDHKSGSKTWRAYPLDPIMTRGLVSIYYKSCEDTLPCGAEKRVPGRKSVRVPPTDTFIPVESSCFQLISNKPDAKSFEKTERCCKVTDANDLQDRRCASGTRGRTLPARPQHTKRVHHPKTNTLSYQERTSENLPSRTGSLSKQNLGAGLDQTDLLSPAVISENESKKDHSRSRMEYHPMLSSHSNVYKTDSYSTRRPR